MSLPPGRGRILELHYTANTFSAPEQARFKYRLDGYDKGWHDAGTRRLRRIQHLENRASLLAAIERERTRLAKDLHDGLGADLTHLTLLADLNGQRTAAPDQDQQLSRTAHRVLHSLKDLIWATRPTATTLEDAIAQVCQEAEERLGGAGLRVRFDLPEDLPDIPVPTVLRRDVVYCVKEAFTNIVRHAEAGEVRLVVDIQDEHITLIIEDDGRGFAVDSPKRRAPPARNGHGLPNMNERIESIGGRFRIRSQPSKGTRIEIELPRRLLRDAHENEGEHR